MGYKCNFLDNNIYGAEDVSRAFSHLISGGTVAYPDGHTVAESLNILTSEITGGGVDSYNRLTVSKIPQGVKISEGVGFFNCGVSVEVDSEGVEIELPSGAENYIYFIYEKEFNRVRAAASASLPEGDTITLARVLADGSIVDERHYATCKNMSSTANNYYDFSVTNHIFAPLSERSDRNTTYVEIPHTGFRYLLLHNVETPTLEIHIWRNIIDLTAEGEQQIRITDGMDCFVKVLRTGNILRIATVRSNLHDAKNTLYFTLV